MKHLGRRLTEKSMKELKDGTWLLYKEDPGLYLGTLSKKPFEKFSFNKSMALFGEDPHKSISSWKIWSYDSYTAITEEQAMLKMLESA